MNERKTESIVREKLRKQGYFNDKDIIVEEQKSDNDIIRNLLINASKHGSGAGFPEFIIRKRNSDTIILIECKANAKCHMSTDKDRPKEYAVDGVLHYASFLKNKFHIVAIAVSGEIARKINFSVFQWNQNEKRYFPKRFNDFLPYNDYFSLFHSSDNEILSNEELLAYAKKLHDEMRDEAKLKEAEKPLLVGALLLALDNGDFSREYISITDPKKLAIRIVEAIEDSLKSANISIERINTLIREFGFITTHTYLTRGSIDVFNPSHSNNSLHKFLVDIHNKVYPFIKKTNNIDLIGKFYSEFLRYSGGDGKGLGIVLTPTHITNLFCELAEVNKNSKVIDICAGTGGFLIAAMEHMLYDEPTVSEIDKIYKKNLIGIETQTNMFALACANMIIRGDGKTNLIQDNCFEIPTRTLLNYKSNIGLINPPYAQKKEDELELNFVKRMLEVLEVGGTGIAIIPQSCVMSTDKNNLKLKRELLENHALKAVMSMPDELFYPTNTVTCVVVFEAHKPHNSNKKTWFGYWKKDGYEKIRNKGRIDYKNLYQSKIKLFWLDMFFNKKEISGFSILQNVSAEDEWLVESYMQTDYTQLNKKYFEHTLKEYVTFRFYNEQTVQVSQKPLDSNPIDLNLNNWVKIKLKDIFKISGTKTTPKRVLEELGVGSFPYVTTQAINNSVDGFYNLFTEDGNVLVIDSAVKGFCSYQQKKFSASDHVEKLVPKFEMNVYTALFLVTLINIEQYRYSYGRKLNQIRIKETEILLPVHNNTPDWNFMERFIKAIPYSSSLH